MQLLGTHQMKKTFLVATGLVLIMQLVVAALSILNLYVRGEMDRLVYDVGFGAVVVLICAYPSFLYFLHQRKKLQNMNQVLKDAQKTAKNADIAKSEFLANMSHEIRTPMNGVMGMAELLAKTDLNEKQKMFADVIVKSGASLLSTINDVLDFSKIEAGQMKLDPAPFNLVEMIEEVSLMISPGFAEKNVELVVRVSPTLPDMVVGDKARIRQLFSNMLRNACKFTEVGHCLVDVSGKLLDGGRAVRLKILIEDTGIGISQENCAIIFDKFTQADTSATRQHEGSGLGLPISSSLVNLMGGKIGVESQLGAGSTFEIDLTLPVDGDVVRMPLENRDFAGARVLVVDDNAVNRSILYEQLSKWKFDKETAASGPEAIAMANQAVDDASGYDLVILDYQMPGMTGGDVARTLQESAVLAQMPIIMLSSVDEMDDGQLFSMLGVAECLVKPASAHRLLKAISSALRTSSGIESNSWNKMLNHAGELHGSDYEQESELPDPGEIDILVAEDNEVNQIVFEQILEASDWCYKIVENGAQALDFNVLYRPKLILMDVSMPVMNGFEATRAIRKEEQGSEHHVPIVAVTAHAITGDRDKCLQAGMDDYLSKPVSPAKLSEMIDRWMNFVDQDEAIADQKTLLSA